MRRTNQQFCTIEHGFFCLYLNLEFRNMDRSIRKILGEKHFRKMIKALNKPVQLSETGEAALEMYESHLIDFLTLAPITLTC